MAAEGEGNQVQPLEQAGGRPAVSSKWGETAEGAGVSVRNVSSVRHPYIPLEMGGREGSAGGRELTKVETCSPLL